MKKLFFTISKVLGSMQFAVGIILCFALALSVGTFVESSAGTDYANRLIYKSVIFMGIQALMFLSVLVATLQRLPYRHHLRGFYLLHLGILMIFIGSFITYHKGIDGTLILHPNEPSSYVRLGQDELSVVIDDSKELTLDLPYKPSQDNLTISKDDLNITSYIPFAEKQIQWSSAGPKASDQQHSSVYTLSVDPSGLGATMTEELILSLHPQSSFGSGMQLGPLKIHYLPKKLLSCLQQSGRGVDQYVIWNLEQGECAPANQQKLVTLETGSQILTYPYKGSVVAFIPDVSPVPVTVNSQKNEQQLITDSSQPLRVFYWDMFKDEQTGPQILIFGDQVLYQDPQSKKTMIHGPLKIDESLSLPWMNIELTLVRFDWMYFPEHVPISVTPVQDNNELVVGADRAVAVSLADQATFWVYRGEPVNLKWNDQQYQFMVRPKLVKLPFEITLKKFQSDFDPGTENPASYESFVSLFDGHQLSDHHIFMNNPLKVDHLTFYQSSYFPIESNPIDSDEITETTYGSVLTVNYDPGRFLKYFGSLLLVFGSSWHFWLRRQKISQKKGVLHE